MEAGHDNDCGEVELVDGDGEGVEDGDGLTSPKACSPHPLVSRAAAQAVYRGRGQASD